MSVQTPSTRRDGRDGRRDSAPAAAGGKHYDRAFQPAIDDGLLTQRQAAERGSRGGCAALLASRHHLTEEIALQVVDNRISLLEAIRQRGDRGPGGSVERKVSDPRWARLGLIVAVLTMAAVTLFVVLRDPAAVAPVGAGATRDVDGVQVRVDGAGRVVQVTGPDPGSVLQAYCDSASRRRPLEPLKVVPSALFTGDRGRLGLLRDPKKPSRLKAVEIRESRESGLWTAGTGDRPLVPRPAPRGAEQALRRR